MLTFFDLERKQKKALQLLRNALIRIGQGSKEDVFIDSGAWSLFRLHVLKAGKKADRKGKHGEDLEAPVIESGSSRGDFSYYNLKKGTPFRTYCDRYALFMKWKKLEPIRFFATVDAIGNPDLTWDTQRFFEEEHGLKPVPVVHFGTKLKYLARYLERNYDMVGLGGFARRPERLKIKNWCDEAFRMVCPASNKYLPITKIHGFAMTTWELIRRWPWFSVDSTSYLLYGTYGLICVPFWREGAFRFDRPPMIVSVSHRGRPIDYKTRMHISQAHGDTREVRAATMKWLEYLGLGLGRMEKDKEVEPGAATSNDIRTAANLRYFMELEASLPKWPWALPREIAHPPHETALMFCR